jgi:hypothetical protein
MSKHDPQRTQKLTRQETADCLHMHLDTVDRLSIATNNFATIPKSY